MVAHRIKLRSNAGVEALGLGGLHEPRTPKNKILPLWNWQRVIPYEILAVQGMKNFTNDAGRLFHTPCALTFEKAPTPPLLLLVRAQLSVMVNRLNPCPKFILAVSAVRLTLLERLYSLNALKVDVYS